MVSGTAPFTYAWSPSGGSAATATNLTAGNYTINVTDANGCVSAAAVSITEPSSLQVQASATGVLCNGAANGTTSVLASGGNPNYSYNWTPTGGAAANASGLIAGAYLVTVTDANGCTMTSSTTVTQPTILNLNMSSTGTLCNGSADGTASVNVSGGTAGYSYSWFPGNATSANATALSVGNYTVTITDANSCTATNSISVTQPVAIVLNTSTTPALCGANNGTASVNTNGGVTPFTYSWSPSGGNGSAASNLSAGGYTVIVTDANGCTSSTTAAVSNSGGPTVNANVTSTVSCYGGANGSATVNVSSGNGPYMYQWLPSGGSSSTASNLVAGNYSINVTDANGCITNVAVSITQPLALSANATSTNASCFGSADGSASVITSGGIAPFTYSWAPGGSNSSTPSGLTAGNYSVTVSDANGCNATSQTIINAPAAINLSLSPTPATCFGSSTGSIQSTVSGGASGFTYSWSPSGGNNPNPGGLPAGNYTVVVTDMNGCTSSNSAIIIEPQAMQLQTSTTASNCGASNGSASVIVSGGNSPYSYSWSPVTGAGQTLQNISAGNYSVVVSDNNNCTSTTSVIVLNIGGPTASLSASTNVTCNGGTNGTASITISGGTGPFTYAWSPAGGNGASATQLFAGNYTVLVTDGNNCITAVQLSILEPFAIVLQTNSTPAACNQANGSASVVASGGSVGYSYLWTPGNGVNATETNLSSGNYQVIVTDGNGCTQIAPVIVGTTGGPTVIVQSTNDVNCNGSTNGSAVISANGGLAPYAYAWSPSGGNSNSASGLIAGNYNVAVTDANNCTSTVSVIISEPDPININTSSTPAACNGGTDGSVSAFANGGVGPYNYLWTPGNVNTSTVNGLAIGNYSVLVTDQNGCIEATVATVNSASAMIITSYAVNVTCFGAQNGSASVNTLGGTSPYSYQWLPAVGNGSSVTNLSGGNYSVTITDANGCANIQNFNIQEPTAIQVSINGNATICNGQPATLSVNANGGTTPYTYTWDNGNQSSSQQVYPNATSSYSVIVSDANGCSITSSSLTITLRPPLTINAIGSGTICSGENITLNAFATGGDGNYSYQWSISDNNISSAGFTPLTDTLVNVIVTDGCGSLPVSTQVFVQVQQSPVINFLADVHSGCVPVAVNFNNTSAFTPGSIFSWNFGDQQYSSEQVPSHVYTQPGIFDVYLQITTPAGCHASLMMNELVHVYPYPIAAYTTADTALTALDPVVHFDNVSSGATSYVWDFGDGSPYNTAANPSHLYADTGSYWITLVATNANGCIDTIRGMIRIEDAFSIYIPNAFTPNGDFINDNFNAYGIGWKDFELFILDRWGLIIYHSTDAEKPWDGTYKANGTLCQNDVYIYKIYVHDTKDKLHTFIGHVTLVR